MSESEDTPPSFSTSIYYKSNQTRNGQRLDYTGGRTENDIVNWILKKAGPPSAEVDCEGLKAKTDANKLVLAYFGENEAPLKAIFIETAKDAAISERLTFVHITDKTCAEQHGAQSPSVLLFRQFDESPLTYSAAQERQGIIQWVLDNSTPTVIDFNEDYIEPIFGDKKAALFLFRNAEDNDAPYVKVFENFAKENKGEILFVKSGVSDGIQSRLGEFIGLDSTQLPAVRILSPADNMKKYAIEGDAKAINPVQLKKFIEEFKEGKLEPFLKSQEVPEDNSAPVKVIVGKTYNEIVNRSPDDVFVKYYAPWCGHCKKLAPVWDQLAEELKDVKGLVIAKLDATANEVEGVDIRGYPTLKFYKHGEKATPVDYDGERDIEGFKKWLSENSAAYKRHLEGKTDL